MRLPRPNITLDIKLRVLCRQIGELTRRPINIEQVVKVARDQRCLGTLVQDRLREFADIIGADPKDFHLDHDPALVNRMKQIGMPSSAIICALVVPRGGKVLRYFPDANDPEHLFYRVGGAGSDHDIKTRVRGDHGALSDLAQARKNKRIEARLAAQSTGGKTDIERWCAVIDKIGRKKKAGPKIASRPFPKIHRPMRRK